MYESQAAEIKKLREEQVGLASRLANALQLAQVSVIEADAAKAQASSAVADGQATHSALTQATHKIQASEAECAKLRYDFLSFSLSFFLSLSIFILRNHLTLSSFLLSTHQGRVHASSQRGRHAPRRAPQASRRGRKQPRARKLH